MKKIIQYSVSLVLACLLLWYVFKGIDLAALWEKFAIANYWWVAVAGLMSLTANSIRSFRWKLMLQPLGYSPSVYRTTLAVNIGYVVNLLLPRAGEFARCGSLQRLEDVPFEKSFGAVVAERLIDVVVLALLIGLNLLLEFDRISLFFFELIGDKLKNTPLLISIAAMGVLLTVALFFLFKKNKAKIEQLPFYQKISSIILGLWGGFTSVRNLKNPMAFLAATASIWILYFFMTYALCFALPETSSLSPLAILTILVMGTIGMATPTVGGIGSYHFFVGKIVVLYGLSQQAGITLATFLHSMMGVAFVLLFGGLSFLLTFFIQNKSK